MASAFAPSSTATAAASTAPSMTRVHLVTAASGRSTLTNTGPGTLELVQNAAGRWTATAVLTGQKLAQTGNNRLLAY